MSLLLVLLGVFVLLVAWVLVKRFADAAERDAIHDLHIELDGKDIAGRVQALEGAAVRGIRRNATLMRSAGWALIAGIILFACCLVYLQDNSDRQADEISRSCNADLNFRRLLDAQRTEDIRVKQAQRNSLADSLTNNPTETEDIPGFDNMPDTVQTFVRNLLAGQVVTGQARLAEFDDDLARLREQVDEIRAFNVEQDCP